MSLRVNDTMIFVRDMDEAVRFYTHKLGFKLEKQFDWGFAYIDMGGGSRLGLMLESKWNREYPDDEGLPKPRISFETDNFEEVLEMFHRKGIQHSTIMGHDGATRAVNFFDEDGNAFFVWNDPNSRMGKD